jgi:hypothetical protein
MIEPLEPNDQRPSKLVAKINEIIMWVNEVETKKGDADDEDSRVVEDTGSSDVNRSSEESGSTGAESPTDSVD